MQQQDPQAPAHFAQLALDWPQDPLVQLHSRRLRNGELGDRMVMDQK
jgi:hypothetical protein